MVQHLELWFTMPTFPVVYGVDRDAKRRGDFVRRQMRLVSEISESRGTAAGVSGSFRCLQHAGHYKLLCLSQYSDDSKRLLLVVSKVLAQPKLIHVTQPGQID